ncbi:unnamed protein product [Pleuronectes platessa]|uniref:Uncharacterized protein n=1 Tax=Pleuronectes platessa TaxID=8262 RepID=A0A9N7W3F3_PLEPL|nr:unnamed protein product [Pleuronectes platessa]
MSMFVSEDRGRTQQHYLTVQASGVTSRRSGGDASQPGPTPDNTHTPLNNPNHTVGRDDYINQSSGLSRPYSLNVVVGRSLFSGPGNQDSNTFDLFFGWNESKAKPGSDVTPGAVRPWTVACRGMHGAVLDVIIIMALGKVVGAVEGLRADTLLFLPGRVERVSFLPREEAWMARACGGCGGGLVAGLHLLPWEEVVARRRPDIFTENTGVDPAHSLPLTERSWGFPVGCDAESLGSPREVIPPKGGLSVDVDDEAGT